MGLHGDRADPAQLACCELGIESSARRAQPVALALARPGHAGSDGGGIVALPVSGELRTAHRRQLDLEIDTIQERARDPTEVSFPLAGRADAVIQRRTAAPAGVGGGHQLKSRRELAHPGSADDRHGTVLERLAE
jgi:hypothetical protein